MLFRCYDYVMPELTKRARDCERWSRITVCNEHSHGCMELRGIVAQDNGSMRHLHAARENCRLRPRGFRRN